MKYLRLLFAGMVISIIVLGAYATYKNQSRISNCEIYWKYRIDVCNNCFNAWFYTNSIEFKDGMIIAVDHYGRERMVRPLEISTGKFKKCP